MNTLSRAALLGAGSAIALVGLPRMTSFVEAAEKADPGDIATLNAAVELERAGIKAYQVLQQPEFSRRTCSRSRAASWPITPRTAMP